MVRKLKHHEQKLLKKFDFLNWKTDNNLHELKIMRKFYIQRREDYTTYNKLSRDIRNITDKLKELPEDDAFRQEMVRLLLTKLHSMGLVPTKASLLLASKVSASAFCRRRLPVVMTRSHMAENLKAAVTFIEQAHVRVGSHVIRDPAYLVTRNMEDFIQWAPGSKIKEKIDSYNGLEDDYAME